MARTSDLHERNAGTIATTEFRFVLCYNDGRARASFSFGSLDEARRAKELMDCALANITGEAWSPANDFGTATTKPRRSVADPTLAAKHAE